MNKAIGSIVGAALLCMSLGLAAQTGQLPLLAQMAVSELRDTYRAGSEVLGNIAPEKRAQASDLLAELAVETRRLQDKYTGKKSASEQELKRDSQAAFDLAKAFWTVAQVRKPGVMLVGNSDGPHECSNHCERVCGYNSIGDLICYNRCVKCCNRTSGC